MAYGMIASGILGAYGSYTAGQSQAQSLNAQADLNMKNAQEAEAQAKLNSYTQQVNASAMIGHQAASFGAFGGANATTYAALAASTTSAELERLNILHQGDVNSIQYQNEAALERAGASSATLGGFLGGFGNLFKGFSDAYTSTYGTRGNTPTPLPTLSPAPVNSSTPSLLGPSPSFNYPKTLTTSGLLSRNPDDMESD